MDQTPSSPNSTIVPSSVSIHTTQCDQGERIFYYSSVIIDHDSKKFGSQFRWKVRLGDIVAVAKNNTDEGVHTVIKSWKPNHYQRKSLNWKIGLVIALRKRIGRSILSHRYECHVQWLDKAMDLNKEEMKSSTLKNTYRPYNNATKNKGSQLPHILINREGDYGVVSMLPRSIDTEYHILLPINITIKNKQEFVAHGIRDGEESRHSLQFCCLRKRITESGTAATKFGKFVQEDDPDAWTQFNHPGVKNAEKSNKETKNPALLNKIPKPLQDAWWKGWIQNSNDIGVVSSPSMLSCQDKGIAKQQISMLGDALTRGWINNRREFKEEEKEEASIEKGLNINSTHDFTMSSSETRATNSNNKNNSLKGVATKKRKKNNPHRNALSLDESTSDTRTQKKKQIRFSADTKKPSSRHSSDTTKKISQMKKPSIVKSSQRRKPPSATTLEKKKHNSVSNSKQVTMVNSYNDDEMGSTATRDTYSTDTTIPTRGSGTRKNTEEYFLTTQSMMHHKISIKGDKIDNSDNEYDHNDSKKNCPSYDSNVSSAVGTNIDTDKIQLPNLPDALNNWKIDYEFMQQTGPFYIEKQKGYFRKLRMTISSGDRALGSLLDEDETGSLNDYHRGNNQCLSFQINVGSVVAVYYEGSVSATNSWTPFSVPFGLAQVKSIFKVRTDNDDDDDNDNLWKLSIKWFYRYTELSEDRRKSELHDMNQKDGLVETYESCDCSVKEVLPAIIELTSDSDSFRKLRGQTRGSNGFPVVRMLCEHLEWSKRKIKKINDWSYDYNQNILRELLSPLKENSPGPLKRVVAKMPKLMYNSWLQEFSATRNNISHKHHQTKMKSSLYDISSSINYFDDSRCLRNPGEAWCCNEPFYIDSSQLKAFYGELTLIPLYKINARGYRYKEECMEKIVRMGDIIHARVEGSKRHPYDCNWKVAEVVAIFNEFVSQGELDYGVKLHSLKKIKHSVKVEVRWFYQRKDIMAAPLTEESAKVIEIFETDLCQVLDAGTDIIGYTKLVEKSYIDDSKKIDDESYLLPHFFCERFWSIKRRSLIPCGDATGRKERGLLHSKYLNKALRSRNEMNESRDTSTNWKGSMVKLINKLTLKDASKNAYNSGKSSLVGRENEISYILNFFRAAFHKEQKNERIKATLFLAGPPGVGKTASVRAAIAELKHDQESGLVPKFNFVSLNGIEVKDPFDVYIKFWEILTGRKFIGSHERACEWLETYFTSQPSEEDLSDNSITIVLLDEIDYLVTEKQSILYNFFDWPKRATELNGRRLVVVGISNTLNLVDQLMPSVQSRCTEKYVFKAYSLNDTVAILKSKINEGSQNYQFFENDAVLFAAKKTAALSGDIRKAFQICRSAAEYVTRRFEDNRTIRKDNGSSLYPKIGIGDVQKASLDSFNIALTAAVSFSSAYEALLLISLANLCRTTGRETGGFDIKDIITKMEALAHSFGDPQYLPPPSFGETIHILTRLGEINLVELKTDKSTAVTYRQSQGGSWPMTFLAVDELTILKGFKSTPHRPLAQKNLPSLF